MMSVKSKNIHVLPTEKPSKLFYNVGGALLFTNYENHNGVNIYITSDEEIKEGDWCFYVNSIYKVLRISSNNRPIIKMSDGTFEISYYKKIILTTDQDLIKDGVQAIDDEFLEWFVKNPSCDEVKVNNLCYGALGAFADAGYKIIIPRTTEQIINEDYAGGLEMGQIIPKEEAKQETLEEAGVIATGLCEHLEAREQAFFMAGFQECIKWKQERMYSEEEVIKILIEYDYSKINYDKLNSVGTIKKWFEKFKNK
jgi:hypothetical protein